MTQNIGKTAQRLDAIYHRRVPRGTCGERYRTLEAREGHN